MKFDMSFDIDNILPLAISTEIMESQVHDMIDYILKNFSGGAIDSEIFNDLTEEFDIDYMDLPDYLLDEITNNITIY